MNGVSDDWWLDQAEIAWSELGLEDESRTDRSVEMGKDEWLDEWVRERKAEWAAHWETLQQKGGQGGAS